MAYDLFYDGQTSDSFGLIIKKVNRSILPQLAGRTVEIPNRIGQYFFRVDLGMRTIEVDVFLEGISLTDLQEKKRAIAKWLDPTKGLRDLIFPDSPGIKWRAVISGETDLDELIRFGQGTFVFLVPDGVGLSTTTESSLIATAGMSFERASTAYFPNNDTDKFDLVSANSPRFYKGISTKFPDSQMLFIERGTTNKLKSNISSAELTLQFNDDTLFWDTPTQKGTFVRDTTTSAHGGASAKLTTNEAGNMSIFQIIPIAATPGTAYAGAVRFKSNNTIADVKSGLVFFNAGLTPIGTVNSTIYHSTSNFQGTLVAGIAPVGTAFIRLELLMVGASPGDRLWWDAAMIEELPANETVTTWHLGNDAGNATRANEIVKVFQGKGLMNDDQSSFCFRFMLGKDLNRNQTLFQSTSAVANADYEIYVDGATNAIKLVYGNGAGYTTLTSATIIAIGTEYSIGWRHVASTGEMTLLINGVAESTNVGNAISYDPTAYAYFGGDGANPSESLFQEFAIWHDTLSDADFLAVHNAVAMPSTDARPANLVNYWALNGNMGGLQQQTLIGGTSPAFPIFTAQMTKGFTGFKIEHQDTGNFIEINETFIAGDILTIDCETNKVTINGSNAIDKLTIASDFFSLPPDTTATFIVTPPDAGDVVLSYTTRWL